MKFIIDNWMLLSVAIVSGGLLVWPVIRGASTSGTSTAAAVQLINRERAILIDVCEPEEFAAAHAGGARNVPLGEFETRLPAVVKNKTLPLILVCKSGARASRAVDLARKLGYEQAQVLAGGMNAWKEANLPIEKAA